MDLEDVVYLRLDHLGGGTKSAYSKSKDESAVDFESAFA
jgi:hypothetical protein